MWKKILNHHFKYIVIKEFSKANSKKQIKIYKKYYGNIEAINEEENESEELKNLLSSRRNEDNSLNNERDINNTSSFSLEESISPNPKTNKKFKYFHKYIKNNKKKLYILTYSIKFINFIYFKIIIFYCYYIALNIFYWKHVK